MESKQTKNKDLIRNIALFFLASFLPKTISFFLVPLYTNCLSTAEYGTIDLIAATVQLLLPVFTLQVQDAVLRFAMEKGQDPKEVFSSGLRITLVGFGIFLVGFCGVCAMGILPLEWPYLMFCLAYYLTGALGNLFQYFLRAIDKIKNLTVASVLTCLVTVGSNLLTLLVFKWGVNGYLVSSILGHIVSIVYIFFSANLARYTSLRIREPQLTKRMILFSVPMIVSALSWWVNNSLDKYILMYFCGVSASGLLAVAYKIPTIISTLANTVSKAFAVSVIREFDQEDRDGFLGESYATVSSLVVLIASGLILLNMALSSILFAKEFFAAWQLVPPLLVAAVMNHMSLSCQHIYIALKKTNVVSATALLGALVNTLLNLCLIPLLKAYGAALATAIGFFIVWLVRYIWILRYVNLKNCRVKEPVSYGLLLCQMILAYWGNRFLVWQVVCMAVIVIMYGREALAILKKLKFSRK